MKVNLLLVQTAKTSISSFCISHSFLWGPPPPTCFAYKVLEHRRAQWMENQVSLQRTASSVNFIHIKFENADEWGTDLVQFRVTELSGFCSWPSPLHSTCTTIPEACVRSYWGLVVYNVLSETYMIPYLCVLALSVLWSDLVCLHAFTRTH